MKKQLTLLTASVVLAFFVFSSCEKDNNDDGSSSKSKTELLAEGTWKFKSATAGGGDVSSMIETCERDNVFDFTSSGDGTMFEGASKCNASDPDNVPFNWHFENSETILVVTTVFFDGGGMTFQLESVSETRLVISQGFSIGPGPVQNVIFTFEH
jgi:hypothetical protein